MFLKEVNEALDHKITGGSEYQWSCWDNSRYLDYESDYAHVSVIFNSTTQEIYQAEVSVKPESWDEDLKPYRWMNPLYKQAYFTEAIKRNIDPYEAWDDTKWTDLEVPEDFLEKAEAIFNGVAFDNRIQVPIELDNELMMQLFMEAHKRDMTLNQLVEEILRNMIATYAKDNIMDDYSQDFG